MRDNLQDKVGQDRQGAICVRYQGALQAPRFQSEGAAQAFLQTLQAGTHTPEPEGRTHA